MTVQSSTGVHPMTRAIRMRIAKRTVIIFGFSPVAEVDSGSGPFLFGMPYLQIDVSSV
jgi:hypothetical protein